MDQCLVSFLGTGLPESGDLWFFPDLFVGGVVWAVGVVGGLFVGPRCLVFLLAPWTSLVGSGFRCLLKSLALDPSGALVLGSEVLPLLKFRHGWSGFLDRLSSGSLLALPGRLGLPSRQAPLVRPGNPVLPHGWRRAESLLLLTWMWWALRPLPRHLQGKVLLRTVGYRH